MKSILGLTWDQINWANKTVNYAPAERHQTNKRDTEVPLNTRAFEALQKAAMAAQTDFVVE